MSDRGRL
jgi:vacuolar protein sorting-associated protein 13A/C